MSVVTAFVRGRAVSERDALHAELADTYRRCLAREGAKHERHLVGRRPRLRGRGGISPPQDAHG